MRCVIVCNDIRTFCSFDANTGNSRENSELALTKKGLLNIILTLSSKIFREVNDDLSFILHQRISFFAYHLKLSRDEILVKFEFFKMLDEPGHFFL